MGLFHVFCCRSCLAVGDDAIVLKCISSRRQMMKGMTMSVSSACSLFCFTPFSFFLSVYVIILLLILASQSLRRHLDREMTNKAAEDDFY